MPTYDYECQSCGHVFEYFQSMSDDPLKECPKCGKEVKRLIGGGMGIIFKGSGFYVTDNRSGSSGSGGGAKKSSSGGGDSKSSDPSSAGSPAGDKKSGNSKESA
ncbi:FmdB family transcriptional regulator [Marispirochaeta aestuarii]|uniref:FmdB family transcriptional regulator n=1 Tax=Marispirochaeta aestuarii TaxID=1963862 RepID=A0A1Y1RXC6_9SPIO|nr:FmdB family zinc ribbon protein [Marispirochaeta aestuarii]ORC34423.1 FmdB family transcriptional regulator [Marispirochaeta aestuarii]